jgi:SSS family transporter
MSPIDLSVILLYVAGCTALGAWMGSGVRGLKGYFLGESNIPAWAVMLSIVATETSTATFLSVPGIAFREGGDFTYLQLALGYVVGRVVVAAVLLPAYFRREIYTAYQVLDRRFGAATRTTASVLFLVTRTLADGLRLFLAALVLREITRWNLPASILVMGSATILYTYLGGMKAVIWTDVIQFAIYLVGALVALALLVNRISGGWPALLEAGRAAGKFRMFDFRLDLSRPYTFWAGLIGGTFLNTATHGADQLMVQRYLSARSRGQAASALVASGLVVLAQFALFLLIGVGLFVLYRGTDLAAMRADRAFAYFIVRSLPVGVLGLVIAAIFSAAMSTLSSSLNASASTTVNDLYRPLRRGASEAHLLRASRLLTGVWGLAQMGVAFAAIRLSDLTVVEQALEIASFTTGIVLGLFLLGVITRRVGQRAALAGFAAGVLAVSYAKFGPRLPHALYPWAAPVAFPWFAAIGSITVFLVGLLASTIWPRATRDDTEPAE